MNRLKAPRGSIGGIPEQIIALAIGAALMVPLTGVTIDKLEEVKEIGAVGQLDAVREAASQYIQDNWTTVHAWAVTPQVIPVSTLVSAGYLSSGYSSTNAYGQTHSVLMRQVGTDLLEAVVLTSGGVALTSGRIAAAAQRGGADAGYIPYTSDPNPCGIANCARGTQGVWEVSLSPHGVMVEAGHFAALLHFNGGAVLADYLYRYEVPGLADANTMHVDLDMGGFSISDALDVTASGVVTGSSGVAPDLVVTAGSSCDRAGLLGRLADGALMVCQDGQWSSAAGSFGGLYQIQLSTYCSSIDDPNSACQSTIQCQAANPYTGSCGCPSGTTPAIASGSYITADKWQGGVQCTSGTRGTTAIATQSDDGGASSGGGDGGGGGGGGGGQ